MQKLNAVLIKYLFVLFAVGASTTVVLAQKMDKAAVERAITSRQFVFKAQTVLPMSGPSRYLTSEYDVTVSGDSLTSYLPYFGRAYSVTYGERGGIDFTSIRFDYKIERKKKGGWNVSMAPKDVKNTQTFNFTVSEDGNTYLQVFSTNRQPIAFYGYIAD